DDADKIIRIIRAIRGQKKKLKMLRSVITSAVLSAVALSAAEHRVQPKATVDHPQFAIRSRVLSDGAILAYYVRNAANGRPTLVLIPETNGDRSQFFERTLLDPLP